MAKPEKKEKLVSPEGRLRFPRLNKPDTKFNEDGIYKTGLVLDAESEEAKALIEAIDAQAEAALKEAKDNAKNPAEAKKWEIKSLPYKMLEDEEGEPTGEVEFSFSTYATFKDKDGNIKKRTVALINALGKRIAEEDKPNVGGGTLAKIAYSFKPYAQNTKIGAGVKLYLNAVQLLEVKEFGGGDGEAFGFGVEDKYANDAHDDDADDSDNDGEDNDNGSDDF